MIPDEPPSIFPRGTIIRPSARPSPALPASAVYIQSVSGFSCSAAQAAGIYDAALTGPEHYHRAEQLLAKASEIIRFRAWADVAGTKLSSG